MRANLDENEKLIPPRNNERGQVRLKQLWHEISRLNDEIKNRKEATPGWVARAKKNLALLKSEVRQLMDWILDQGGKVEGDG